MVTNNTFKMRRTFSPFNANEVGQRFGNIAGTLAPVGGFIDLPGPAAGYVRFYDPPWISSATPAVTIGPCPVVLNPLGVTVLTVAATGASAPLLPTPLGPGESYRITNNHAANAASIIAAYIDVANQDGCLTLVRQPCTPALSTVIPAPPTGFFRRWNVAWAGPTGTPTIIPRCWTFVTNRDTVAQTVELVLSGLHVGRFTGGAGVLVGFSMPAWVRVTAATGPMRAQTIAAVTTTPPMLFGCYETIADTQPIDG